MKISKTPSIIFIQIALIEKIAYNYIMDKLKEIADIITTTNGDDEEEKEMMIWQICAVLDVEMRFDED